MQPRIFVCFGKVRGWLEWKPLWSSITTSNQSASTQEQRARDSASVCMYISFTKYPRVHIRILPPFPTHFTLRYRWHIVRHPDSKTRVVSTHSLHQNARTDACPLKCPFPRGFPLGHIAFDLSHNHNLCGSVCEPQPGWCKEKGFTFPVIYYSHLLRTWSLWSSVYFTGSNWTCGLLRNTYVRNSTHIPASQEINEIVSLVLALL